MCVCMYVFVCRELGIAIVPYSPLGRGFFAGYTVEGNKEGDTRAVCDLPITTYLLFLYSRNC
jgi:aryl-alcohol dehydrogenase-like predicted oxidoreductase